MIRIAGFFALIALSVLLVLISDLSGATAILFVFVGFPTLAIALAIYLIFSWRAGTFRSNHILQQR